MAKANQCDMNLLDSKESCSICLEPYAGRKPKLLPCFHTFCVQCLSDLAKVSSISSEGGAGCATITCPACRKVTPVPPGGVDSFQANFYIDNDTTQEAAVHSPCQLCDEGEESTHKCGRCGQFCQRCHRVHSKLCSAPVTSLLPPASLEQKVETLTKTLAQYKLKNTALEHKTSTLEQKNQALEHKTSTLERKNDALEQKNDALTREVQNLRDKITLVCQDLAMLQTQDHTKVMKEDHTHVMKDDHTQVLKDLTQQLQGLRQETSTNSRHLQDLQTSSAELQTSSKAHDAALADFKTHLAKSRTQVAFNVLLHADVKVRSERVLILKQEVVNMGQCYNTSTGYFTAPVAGVYSFMATAATAEEYKCIKMFLVHEGKDIAYLGTDQESCTCHASVRVAQGDRVWLRTCKPEDGDYRPFLADWLTSFTGVLVHPDF